MAQVNLENLISLLPSGNFKREIVRSIYGPKVRDIRPDNDEPIKAQLRYIFTLIGLKPENFPDDTQKMVLINFIRTDLGHFGLDEFRIAFHMGIKGELGLPEKDFDHYQNFSCKYLAFIMAAYHRRVRKEAMDKFKEIELREKEKMNNPTEEEKNRLEAQFLRESVVKPYKYYLKTGVISFGILPYGILYKALCDRTGLINLSKEEKISVRDRAIEEIKKRISKPTMDPEKHKETVAIVDKIEKFGFNEAMKDPIRDTCHEISVRDFFENSKRDGIDLESVIESWIRDNLKI